MKACVMVLAGFVVLASAMVFAHDMVLTPVLGAVHILRQPK